MTTTKQELARKLETYSNTFEGARNSKGAYSVHITTDFIEDLRSVARELLDDGWRDIKDAPVDNGQHVIVATHEGAVGEAYCEPERNEWYWAGSHWTDSHDGSIRGYELAAWMPLPSRSPPKGKE